MVLSELDRAIAVCRFVDLLLLIIRSYHNLTEVQKKWFPI